MNHHKITCESYGGSPVIHPTEHFILNRKDSETYFVLLSWCFGKYSGNFASVFFYRFQRRKGWCRTEHKNQDKDWGWFWCRKSFLNIIKLIQIWIVNTLQLYQNTIRILLETKKVELQTKF